MGNPCKECLVTSMCKESCEKMREHLKILLDQFRPSLRVNVHPDFLLRTCNMIRNKMYSGNGAIEFDLDFYDVKDIPCVICLEEGHITDIKLREKY